MAHFHYTIMGGLIFAFFAAIYYWVPKMTGLRFNERLAKIHFWSMFIAFNSTFGPLFALGLMGMPRRVATYASNLQALNIWVSVSAFVLGASMLVFLANVLYSLVIVRKPAEANPWDSKSHGVAGADAGARCTTSTASRSFDADPYDYGVPPAPPRARSGGRVRCGAVPGAEVNEMAESTRRRVRRAAGGSGAQPVARGSGDGRGDDHVLPRLRLRLLLPALAQQRRSLATRRHRSAAGLRRRDRRSCSSLSAALFAYADRAARSGRQLVARGRGGAGARPRAAASSRGSSTRTSGSAPPRAATRASSSAGRSCSRCSRSSRCTGWRSSSPPAFVTARGEAYVPHGLDAASFYWTLLAVIGVIAWVILYLL